MEKSMYSLILMDEVVRKVDEAAYRHGMSRSALINQILADYVSLITPKKQIEAIFEQLSRTVESGGALQVQQTTDSMLYLRSVLNYRYNPTIRYSVELELLGGGYVCEFKVISRTQSDALVGRLTSFYELWCQIERYMLRNQQVQLRHWISGGRFRRRLGVEREGAPPDAQLAGRSIGNYVRLFDTALKLTFSAEGGLDMQMFEQITTLYSEYLKTNEIIV